jgi:Bifunctional DNA primase/polymerase, N-terminal
MNARRPVLIAQELADEGFRVAPATAQKLPTIPGLNRGAPCRSGWNAASNNSQVINLHFWHWPGPLVLHATGSPSGLDVLDLDERHGGAAAFARIKDRLPRTRIFRTGGDGGWHIQFVHHPGMRSIPQGGLRGLDGAEVKSTGGYAIAWWAMGIVEIIDDTPPAPWPDFLLEAASYRPPPPIEQVAPCQPPEFSREESIALRGFAGAVGRVATAALGNRNAVTFWAACRAGELVT